MENLPAKYFYSGLRLLTGMIRSVYQPSKYDIKCGYRHSRHALPYDDRGHTEEFQKEVYELAAIWMNQHQGQTIIDIGCGSGYKLIHYLGRYHPIGVDVDPVISQARSDYPEHTWLPANSFNPSEHSADLILCADVIEHVEKPDEFIQWLLSIQNWKCLMISTPERNVKHGKYHFGPPTNPHHWREWSSMEFNKFISRFCPVSSQILINPVQGTQLLVCLRS